MLIINQLDKCQEFYDINDACQAFIFAHLAMMKINTKEISFRKKCFCLNIKGQILFLIFKPSSALYSQINANHFKEVCLVNVFDKFEFLHVKPN